MPRSPIPALLAAGFTAAVVAVPSVASAQAASACDGWTKTTLATGLGVLENLEPDRRGGLLLSSSSASAVLRLTPDGSSETFLADVDRPGGMRVRGSDLFVNTGDGATSAALDIADGTVLRVDLDTLDRATYTDGLVMPNGLVFDAAGNAYVSRSSGNGANITMIPVADPANPVTPWADVSDTNGLVISADGTTMFAATTFNQPADVLAIALDDPSDITVVASLAGVGSPAPKGLDDLEIDADDVLYITANGSGEVLRLDPVTGDACVVADGIGNPSAIKFGDGVGFPADRLYVSAFDGSVTELTPPATAPGPVPSPAPSPAPSPGPTDAGIDDASLPATGGGLVPTGLAMLATAAVARRRRSR